MTAGGSAEVVFASTLDLGFPGGVQRNYRLISAGLGRRGVAVVEANAPASVLPERRNRLGRRIWRRLHATSEEVHRIRLSIRRLKGELRGLPADLPCLAFDAWAAIACRAEGRRLVYRTPAMTWATVEYRENGYLGDSVLTRRLLEEERRAIRGADRVVTLSERGRRVFQSLGVPEDRLTVLPNFISIGPQSAEPGGESAAVRLLWVGHLKPLKGLDVLLEAVAGLTEPVRERVEIAVVGDGATAGNPVYEQALEVTRRTGLRVEFTGRLTPGEVGDRMLAAHLFVLSSLPGQEHFSNVALEAMASGLPVVATDVGALPEMLGEGGAEWIVPPGDAGALGCAIGRLASDPALRADLGRANRRRVADAYVEESVIPGYVAALGLADPPGPLENLSGDGGSP